MSQAAPARLQNAPLADGDGPAPALLVEGGMASGDGAASAQGQPVYHGAGRRLREQIGIVARHPMAAGKALVFSGVAVMVSGGGGPIAAGVAALFAVGGAFETFGAARKDLIAYRRAHVPPAVSKPGEPGRPHWIDRLLEPNATGKMIIGTAQATMVTVNVAVGNIPGAVSSAVFLASTTVTGVGQLAADRATDAAEARVAERGQRPAGPAAKAAKPEGPEPEGPRPEGAAPLSQPRASQPRASLGGRLLHGARDAWAWARATVDKVAHDPLAVGQMLGATALGLGIGFAATGPLGIAGGLLATGGGALQAVLVKRDAIRARRCELMGLPPPALPKGTDDAMSESGRWLQALRRNAGGTILQAVGFGLAAVATPVTTVAYAMGSYLLANTLVATGLTSAALRRDAEAARLSASAAGPAAAAAAPETRPSEEPKGPSVEPEPMAWPVKRARRDVETVPAISSERPAAAVAVVAAAVAEMPAARERPRAAP